MDKLKELKLQAENEARNRASAQLKIGYGLSDHASLVSEVNAIAAYLRDKGYSLEIGEDLLKKQIAKLGSEIATERFEVLKQQSNEVRALAQANVNRVAHVVTAEIKSLDTTITVENFAEWTKTYTFKKYKRNTEDVIDQVEMKPIELLEGLSLEMLPDCRTNKAEFEEAVVSTFHQKEIGLRLSGYYFTLNTVAKLKLS